MSDTDLREQRKREMNMEREKCGV